LDWGLIVVFKASFGGDFIEESRDSICVVKSLTAELGLLNFQGVPFMDEAVSVLGVG